MLDNILRNTDTKVVANFMGITLFWMMLIFLKYTQYIEYQHGSMIYKSAKLGAYKYPSNIPSN